MFVSYFYQFIQSPFLNFFSENKKIHVCIDFTFKYQEVNAFYEKDEVILKYFGKKVQYLSQISIK